MVGERENLLDVSQIVINYFTPLSVYFVLGIVERQKTSSTRVQPVYRSVRGMALDCTFGDCPGCR